MRQRLHRRVRYYQTNISFFRFFQGNAPRKPLDENDSVFMKKKTKNYHPRFNLDVGYAKIIGLSFDGGCIPNPGRGYGSFRLDVSENNQTTIGSVVRVNLNQKYGYDCTCNIAELETLRIGLVTAKDNNLNLSDSVVCLYGDSVLALNIASGAWKCREPHLKAIRDSIWSLLNFWPSFTTVWYGRDNSVSKFGH